MLLLAGQCRLIRYTLPQEVTFQGGECDHLVFVSSILDLLCSRKVLYRSLGATIVCSKEAVKGGMREKVVIRYDVMESHSWRFVSATTNLLTEDFVEPLLR
jgi:hypothetical protein